jgi:hypothetical protein
MFELFDSPESQIRDVAATLLRLTPSARRAAIRPLIALIEHVVERGCLRNIGEGEQFDAAISVNIDPRLQSRRQLV